MNNATHSRESQRARGFTLLEVVFVLGMIAMIVAWVTLTTASVDAEKQLRESSGDIVLMIKRARSIAVMQQRPYQVTISEDSVSMAPQFFRADAGKIEVFDEDVERENFENITASESTDPDVKYEIRRWRSDFWQEMDKDHKVVLTLDPAGLVEPIAIRCSVGKSWLLQELHPLTGGVRDEEMSIEEG